MFTKEEMEKGGYTPEDVEVIQKFKEYLHIDRDNIKQSEKNIKMAMQQSADIFLSELETYRSRTDRKVFIVTTPGSFSFKGSYVIPLIYARFFIKSINRASL